MKEEIIEGNKLIAEFDGKKFIPYKGNSSYDKKFKTYQSCANWIKKNVREEGYVPELGWNVGMGKYHSSWDWLMPACRKFDMLNIEGDEYLKYSDELDKAATLYELLPLFNQLVKCIKWYNQNKEK